MSSQTKSFAKFGITGLLICFSMIANAQISRSVGTCNVTVTGPNPISYRGEVTGKEKKVPMTTGQNIRWGRIMIEEYRAVSPNMAKAMERGLANPNAAISMGCASDKNLLTIGEFTGKVPEAEFSGVTRSWPLVANSSSAHKDGTITAVFMSNEPGKMMSLTPTEIGELIITKFTDTDFEGSFEFISGEHIVKGDFDFELKKVEK